MNSRHLRRVLNAFLAQGILAPQFDGLVMIQLLSSGLHARKTLHSVGCFLLALLAWCAKASIAWPEQGSRWAALHHKDFARASSQGAHALSHVPGGIPRIIHQVFLSGTQALDGEARAGRFKPHWWRSCMVHNPGWQYMLWDKPAAIELLQHRYPWYLPIFNQLNSIVLMSDAIRIFILHALGGVYLDMDTECFGSIEPSLTGHSLVLPCEENDYLNNAQMASVPRHPLWRLMIRQAKKAGTEPSREGGALGILTATGPKALTKVFQDYLNASGCTPHPGLHGLYQAGRWPQHTQTQAGNATHTRMDFSAGHTIRVYPKGSWFSPCSYKDMECFSEVSRCATMLHTLNLCLGMAVRTNALSGLCPGMKDTSRTPVIEQFCEWQYGPQKGSRYPSGLMLQDTLCGTRFGQLVGLHQFMNTWLGDTAERHNNMKKKILQSVLQHMRRPELFVVAHRLCSQYMPLSTLNTSQQMETLGEPAGNSSLSPALQPSPWTTWLDQALWPVTEVSHLKSSTNSTGTMKVNSTQRAQPCQMLSIHLMSCRKSDGRLCSGMVDKDVVEGRVQYLALQAKRLGCDLTLMTDAPDRIWKHNKTGTDDSSGHVTVVQLNIWDQGDGKEDGQDGVLHALKSWSIAAAPGSSLDVLHISAPGLCTWKFMALLDDMGFEVIQKLRPLTLLVELGPVCSGNAPLVARFYWLVQQGLGYVGHAHHMTRMDPMGMPDGACPMCDDGRSLLSGGMSLLLSPIWLGFVRWLALPGLT